MKNLIINPTLLTFITTYKCTSACQNCCFECNPKRKERLSVDDMIKYIDFCVHSYKSLKLMVLTGGEVFTYGNSVDKIIGHATSVGLKTRIVSNGFWAKNYEYAYKRIENLIKVGLEEINLSTGDDHLEFVPIETIRNAALASLRQNLTVAINVESADDRKFDSSIFIEDNNFKEYLANEKLHIVNGLWIPFKSKEKSTTTNIKKIDSDKKLIRKGGYCRCRNIFTGITIDPNHRLLACCGLTSKSINFLDLGDIQQSTIKELYDRQFNDFMKIWIATEGTHKIMDFISVYTDVNPEYKIEHPCQVCKKIFSNNLYLKIVKDNYRKEYSNIILKYFINKKEIENENT